MAYVIIAFFFGLAGGIVGKIKGSSFLLWFLISLSSRSSACSCDRLPLRGDELRRQCPRCGRVTKLYDAVCMRCGAELEFPEVAIAPNHGRTPAIAPRSAGS